MPSPACNNLPLRNCHVSTWPHVVRGWSPFGCTWQICGAFYPFFWPGANQYASGPDFVFFFSLCGGGRSLAGLTLFTSPATRRPPGTYSTVGGGLLHRDATLVTLVQGPCRCGSQTLWVCPPSWEQTRGEGCSGPEGTPRGSTGSTSTPTWNTGRAPLFPGAKANLI